MARLGASLQRPTQGLLRPARARTWYKAKSYLEDIALPEPWVSVEDVAHHLGVSKDTLYRWIEARRLPAHKVGRFWKFKLQEVDDWVRAGGAAEAGQKTEGER